MLQAYLFCVCFTFVFYFIDIFFVYFLWCFDFLTEDSNDHLPQSSDLAQSHNNVIHNDLAPVNRNRAATTGVIVNTPAANTTTNINTTNSTTTTTTNSTTTKDNDSPRLFNNVSNSKPFNRAQSPKIKSPPVVPERPPPASPAKPKRTSGNHTSGSESPRVPVQSPRVSSQSPKPAVTHGVKFGAVETIPDDDDYPMEPPALPKKPPIPARNSLSPPLPNTSPGAKTTPPASSSNDQGYYVFSPDDDESSSEGDYDEDETAVGAG